MFIQISKGGYKATYFDTESLKRYDVEIGHLKSADGVYTHDMNVIIAWEYEYDKDGKEIDDIHQCYIIDFFFGETDKIDDAIEYLRGCQEHSGKKYIIEF